MGWIYYLSDQPRLPHPMRQLGIADYLFDYTAHAFTFGVLTWLAWRAAQRIWAASATIMQLGVGVFATLYAMSDELHQMLIRGRKARISDWLADVAGIVVTLILIAIWRRYGIGRAIARRLGR